MLYTNCDKKQIEMAIGCIVERTMRMDLTWDWSGGVAYYGVALAYQTTGNESYLALLKDRVDELIGLGLPEWSINNCAMGHCLLTLYEATQDKTYWDILLSKTDYLLHCAPRFGEGILQHIGFSEQAWADTLFMAAFFCCELA